MKITKQQAIKRLLGLGCRNVVPDGKFLHNFWRMVVFMAVVAVWGLMFVAVAPISFYSNTLAAVYAFVFLTATFAALVTWGDNLDKFFKSASAKRHQNDVRREGA